MMERLDEMVIASAFTNNPPGLRIGAAALGATLDAEEREHFTKAVTLDRGIDFVLQEAVTLSTMPVWHESRFEPRPFILRLYLARTRDGWTVMPGGFVRIADGVDAHAVSLQKGGRTADACVLSERPVAETTLLPTPERIEIQRAACCRAGLLTICSGSAVMSSAPKRRCAWCAHSSTASPRPAKPRR